jgi:lipopolysaccharide biosynthesis glycosyltransferase
MTPEPGAAGRVIHIAMAAEAAYALPLAVTLRSLLDNLASGWQIEAHIVSDGLPAAARLQLAESLDEGRVALEWLEVPESAFEGLPLWGTMPATTYSRLLLGELLPASVARVLWLDCDVLVLGNVADLWEEPLHGALVGAVRDPFIPSLGSRFGIAEPARLGLAPEAPYFNAGVLLMDLAAWREQAVGRRTLEYLRNHRDRVFYQDQAALNAVLAGAWQALPARWNSPPAPFRDGGRPEVPGIVHFAGSFKPWRLPATAPLTREYWRYADRTAWSGWRPRAGVGSAVLSWYGGSALRRWVRPLEQRLFELYMIATRRYERERV